MKHLPGYDRTTRRSEVAAFLSLGVTALVVIGFAVFDSMNFASERDCIVSVLSGGTMIFDKAEIVSRTNIAVVAPPATQTKPAGAPGPPG